VQYAFAVGRGPTIMPDELPPEFRSSARVQPALPSSGDRAHMMREALKQANGNIGEAAKMMGISRPTFWRWRKKHGV